MNDILNVCKYIIQFEKSNGRSVSNLRLQKLLYFIQAQFLVEKGTVCFNSEIQAWQYGPVVPDAYIEYKFFGSIGIQLQDSCELNELIPSEQDRGIIDEVLKATSSISTNRLVDISHDQSPWIDAYKVNEKNVISTQSMKKYFLS